MRGTGSLHNSFTVRNRATVRYIVRFWPSCLVFFELVQPFYSNVLYFSLRPLTKNGMGSFYAHGRLVTCTCD